MIARITLFAVTAVLYLVMVLWSLPKISSDGVGLRPFDLWPMSFTFDEAPAFRSALSDAGVTFFAEVQLVLDTAYPALLALCLSVALIWAWQGMPRWIPAVLVMASVWRAFHWSKTRA